MDSAEICFTKLNQRDASDISYNKGLAVDSCKQLENTGLFLMEKGSASSLFVNDGSFMERFKQLQQEKGAAQKESKPGQTVSETSTPKPITSKTSLESKVNVSRKFTPIASSGKLAFSLKQKSKLVAASVKLSEDEGEEENDAGSDSGPQKRLKLGQPYPSDQSSEQVDVAPPSPTDPTVKKVADKLASFVAKNGRQFEHITRQKNPGDTPFKFLFDESCADYKYYEHRLSEEKKALSLNKDSQTSQSGVTSTVAPSSASMSQRSYQEHSKYQAPSSASGSQRSRQQHSSYQTPASALYESGEDIMSVQTASSAGESSGPADADPIARMEFYMKKAAQEERRRQPKHSKDEMPPPASLQGTVKKGHHMGDYIPPDELAKFLASCNDVAAQKAAKEVAERSKIQSDNVGHKLLSKMGWKEGEGLGTSRSGIADPIKAGDVKRDHLGVGAHQPGEVTAEDDIYEQYKKRMMLGYKYRPNPLNNPRKAYY